MAACFHWRVMAGEGGEENEEEEEVEEDVAGGWTESGEEKVEEEVNKEEWSRYREERGRKGSDGGVRMTK